MKKTALPLFLGAAFTATVALSPAAHAISKKVHSPYVTEGEWEIEHYGDYNFNTEGKSGTGLNTKTAIGYAPTDFWKVEVEGIANKSNGGNLKYTGTEIVNKFQLTDKGEYAVDVGLYTAYKFVASPAEADEIEAILLLAKQYGQWSHYANIKFETEVGENNSDDIGAAFSWQSAVKVTDSAAVGFEYYGDLGAIDNTGSFDEQEHQTGPIVKFDIPHTPLEMRVGYLFGLSDASPDGAVTWKVEYAF